jgi:hypothetical protein
METMRTEQNTLGSVEAPSDKLLGDANSQMEMSSTPAQDVYEIRPRKDRNGFDLISESPPTRPNLVCRTRCSSQRGRIREVPFSLAFTLGDHPGVQ